MPNVCINLLAISWLLRKSNIKCVLQTKLLLLPYGEQYESHFFWAFLSQFIVQFLHCDNFLRACAFLRSLNVLRLVPEQDVGLNFCS